MIINKIINFLDFMILSLGLRCLSRFFETVLLDSDKEGNIISIFFSTSEENITRTAQELLDNKIIRT